jgi:hypothetical protein
MVTLLCELWPTSSTCSPMWPPRRAVHTGRVRVWRAPEVLTSVSCSPRGEGDSELMRATPPDATTLHPHSSLLPPPSTPSERSPWSNEYDPPLEDGAVPSKELRQLEISANGAFDAYRELYFEGGVSSVYLWDLEPTGFAGVVLIKKGAFVCQCVRACARACACVSECVRACVSE